MLVNRFSAVLAFSTLALECSALSLGSIPGQVAMLFNGEAPRLGWPPRPPPPGHPPKTPGGPHGPPSHEDKTILQVLEEDKHFTRIFKLVNITDSVAYALNDTESRVTFFAPPDSALKPPKRRHGHREEPSLESLLHSDDAEGHLDMWASLEGLMDETDDDDDDKRKERFKKLLEMVLMYHILPGVLSSDDLQKNQTFGTSLVLHDGSFDEKPERIRVTTIPKPFNPTLVVNLYSHVIVPNVKTMNGYIHVVSKPLLPPGSAFETLFLISDVFSTFTSALQRVGLTDDVDWRYVPGSGDERGALQGTPSLTVFAPTNRAFSKLPKKLKLFLFSPFGERVLRKLLEFHVVPDYVLFSDWRHNATSSFVPCSSEVDDLSMPYNDLYDLKTIHEALKPHNGDDSFPGGRPKRPRPPHVPHQEPVFSFNKTLDTLWKDHPLKVHVAQYERRLPVPPHKPVYITRFFANGQPVGLADVPARNGAIHFVGRVLNPMKHDHGHKKPHRGDDDDDDDEDEWKGWEDWLVRWADDN